MRRAPPVRPWPSPAPSGRAHAALASLAIHIHMHICLKMRWKSSRALLPYVCVCVSMCPSVHLVFGHSLVLLLPFLGLLSVALCAMRVHGKVHVGTLAGGHRAPHVGEGEYVSAHMRSQAPLRLLSRMHAEALQPSSDKLVAWHCEGIRVGARCVCKHRTTWDEPTSATHEAQLRVELHSVRWRSRVPDARANSSAQHALV